MEKLPKPPKPEECKVNIYSPKCLKMQREKNIICDDCPFKAKK